MCLFPKLIYNRRYKPNAKNGYTQLTPTDERELYVPIGCGNCIECRKQKANEWKTRLNEELKVHKHVYFVTLTISNETFAEICSEEKTNATNAIAKILMRRFLERWRRKHRKSLTHWFITELGENTDRLHLHGFIFSEEDIREEIDNFWQYGHTFIGDYCNAKTINYCVKYALKVDVKHKDYRFIILCSPGIGANYIERNKRKHQYNENTIETYKLPNGCEIGLPIYYRNKLFTDEERTKLWMQRLDKHTRYIRGIKIDISTEKGIQKYEKILKYQQKLNREFGYGDDSKEWQKKEYNITLRKLNAKRSYQNAPKTAKNTT